MAVAALSSPSAACVSSAFDAFLFLFQVIVTTPMEMLKIQLQDAGRLGKRKLNPAVGVTQTYPDARSIIQVENFKKS